MSIERISQSMVAAIQDKYGTSDVEQDLEFIQMANNILLPNGPQGRKEVASGLQIPHQLVLHGCSVETAGDPDELKQLCGHITELDLAQNCIKEWDEIKTMLDSTPAVHFLNLSQNKLSDSISKPPSAKQRYSGVSHLILNHLQLSWPTVLNLLCAFTGVSELHLSFNDYKTVAITKELSFPSVESLYFNGNQVTSWESVCNLGQTFPNLTLLVLAENPISSLEHPAQLDMAGCFPNLCRLFMGRTNISSWSELERLNDLLKLCDLRLHDTPLMSSVEYDIKLVRQLTIAYLPRINQLNGSPITSVEREDAERAFIRHFMDQEHKPERFNQLVEVHGKLDRLIEVNLDPAKYLQVVVRFQEKSKLWTMNLDHTVGEFKKSLVTFVGAPTTKWRVYYLDKEGWMGAVDLKYNSRKLHSLNIPEGTEFIVEMK